VLWLKLGLVGIMDLRNSGPSESGIQIKKLGEAGSYNFQTKTPKFRQNSDRNQKISNTEDYRYSKFEFC